MKPLKEWAEEDVIEFRVRADGVLRKMILVTWALCALAVAAAWALQLFND